MMWRTELILEPFLLGLGCAGIASFLHVIVIRDAAGTSWMHGRSHCDGCGTTLRPLELIPILSFVVARGRCARCRARIPRRYPLAELAAAGAGISAWWVADGLALGALLLLSWLLLWLALFDIEIGMLPRAINGTLLVLGVAAAPVLDRPLWEALASALILGGLLALVRWAYRRARGIDGLGLGDVLLGGAGGAWIEPGSVPVVILVACLSALVWVAVSGRLTGAQARLAFAPFLCFGIWVAVLQERPAPGPWL